ISCHLLSFQRSAARHLLAALLFPFDQHAPILDVAQFRPLAGASMIIKPIVLTMMATVVCSLGATSPASSQSSYPSRPITLIVPFPPGGSTDVVGRIVAERMRVSLGQPIII